MSHYPIIVLVDGVDPADRRGVEREVERLLAPYEEPDGEWGADGSRWDWWVVGGRWTGALDPSYDPTADPLNIEACWLCDGTGTRPADPRPVAVAGLALGGLVDDVDRPVWDPDSAWAKECGGCNGCRGTGRTLRMPSQWAPCPTDVVPAGQLAGRVPGAFTPRAVVTPDGDWFESSRVGLFATERRPEAEPGAHRIATGESPGDWGAQVERLLAEHAGTVAVVVDAHV